MRRSECASRGGVRCRGAGGVGSHAIFVGEDFSIRFNLDTRHRVSWVDVTVKHPGFAQHLFLRCTAASPPRAWVPKLRCSG